MPSDPFQMVMVHRTFRNEFANSSKVVRAVVPGDTRRSAFIGRYLGNVISVLHHHHAAEDDLLWPKLLDRMPFDGSTFQRAEDEHAVIGAAIDKVERARSVWARQPGLYTGEQLAAAIEELSARADEHFDYEEMNVVPLIAQHITQGEWQEFIDRGAATVGPKNLWFSLAYSGFLLADATPEERRRFLASVPAPLRIVVTLLGGRAHAGYRAKLAV